MGCGKVYIFDFKNLFIFVTDGGLSYLLIVKVNCLREKPNVVNEEMAYLLAS